MGYWMDGESLRCTAQESVNISQVARVVVR
jgi:hypothetical protein